MSDALQELQVMIRAKYPLIYIQTWEEERVEEALKAICQKLNEGPTSLPRQLHTWSVTQAMEPPIMNRIRDVGDNQRLPAELEVLAEIHEAAEGAVFLLRDYHPYLRDNRVVRLLRDLSGRLRGKTQTLVLVSPTLNLPMELEKDITVLEFPLPGPDEIGAQLDEVISNVKDNPKVDVNLDPLQREQIIKAAQGLTLEEIESAFARSLVEVKKLDIDRILEEKKQIVKKSGLLEYYPADNKMGDVGGFDLLKDWLEKREEAFTDKARDFGIPNPKGVLLLGVQGCGKSLIAKAIAATWNLPMLKLDVGRIFGSLVGQSEENIRKAIRVAEGVAPCVLWADELEKGFAGTQSSGVSDGGTTARVFSTFLTWMQEKTKPVFLIATANDVTKLPPELLRKGRFDEIFFIDLPQQKDREEILAIHLNKRKRNPANYDLAALAKETKGYSGAELEQIVVSSLYDAFDAGTDITQEILVNEAHAQVPLSRMMSEEIDELRTWATLRARPSATRKGED